MSPQIWNRQKVVVAALSPKYDVLQVGHRRGEFKADLADTDSITNVCKAIGKVDSNKIKL